MVLESESIIRMETVEMVREAGYAVIDAPNGDA
jgi:hypothetical protein